MASKKLSQLQYVSPEHGMSTYTVVDGQDRRTTIPNPTLTSFNAANDRINTEEEAAQFLKLATFGATVEEIEELLAIGSKRKWLQKQINSRFDKNNPFREWDGDTPRAGWLGEVAKLLYPPRGNSSSPSVPRFAIPSATFTNRALNTAFFKNRTAYPVDYKKNEISNGKPQLDAPNPIRIMEPTTNVISYDEEAKAAKWAVTNYISGYAYITIDDLINGTLDTTSQYTISFRFKIESTNKAGVSSNLRYRLARTNASNTVLPATDINMEANISNDFETESGWDYFTYTFTPANSGNEVYHGIIISSAPVSSVAFNLLIKDLQFEKRSQRTWFTEPKIYKDPNASLMNKLTWTINKLIPVSTPGGGFTSETTMVQIMGWYSLLSRYVFKNYVDLLEEVSYNTSMSLMLTHLRNQKSDATRDPDENYARELLQLFTLGLYALNPDGTYIYEADGSIKENYTNADILEFSKIFTGLTYWRNGGNNDFRIRNVDALPELPNPDYPPTYMVIYDGSFYMNLSNTDWYKFEPETGTEYLIRSYYTLPPVNHEGDDLTTWKINYNESGEFNYGGGLFHTGTQGGTTAFNSDNIIVYVEDEGKFYVKSEGAWHESPTQSIPVIEEPTSSTTTYRNSVPTYSIWMTQYPTTSGGEPTTAKRFRFKNGAGSQINYTALSFLGLESRISGDSTLSTGLARDTADNYTDSEGNYYPAGISPRLRHYWPWYEWGAKTLLDGAIHIPENTDPKENIRSALEQLIKHSSCAPFVSKSLIKLLTTSNPSPAYVERVSRVFADNGRGVTGDLAAVWIAILTDPEVSYSIHSSPDFGRVRDGYELFGNLSKTLDAFNNIPILADNNSTALYINQEHIVSPEKGVFQPATSTTLGTWPFMSPSIFSYYPPEFKTFPGIEWNLVTPEFGSLTPPIIATAQTRLDQFLEYSGSFYTNGSTTNLFTTDLNQALGLDLSTVSTRDLLKRVSLLFTGGTVSEDKLDIMEEIMNGKNWFLKTTSTSSVTVPGTNNIELERYITSNNQDGSSSAFGVGQNFLYMGPADIAGYSNPYIHWPNITIPNGSPINSANLVLKILSVSAASLISIYIKDVDSATIPTTEAQVTDESTYAEPYAELLIEDAVTYNVDVTNLVQHVINRPGWSSGNNIQFILRAEPRNSPNTITFNDFLIYPDDASELTINFVETTAVDGTVTLTIESGFGSTNTTDVILVKHDDNNYIQGTMASYNSGSGQLVVNVREAAGAGTYTSWEVHSLGQQERRALAALRLIQRTIEFWVG